MQAGSSLLQRTRSLGGISLRYCSWRVRPAAAAAAAIATARSPCQSVPLPGPGASPRNQGGRRNS